MKNLERKKTIIWDAPQTSSRDVADTTGLEYLQSIQTGKTSPPPIAMLVGYRIAEVDRGRTVYELLPQECHYNPFATVHGGIISTLLDTAMTASILTTLGKGLSCVTIEVKINFIRPITIETGRLRCEATVIHIGKRLATAEGRVKDKNGDLYAHGMSTCSLLKIGNK